MSDSYKKFAILHGQSSTIPVLPDNVLGFTNDTNKLYIGNGGKNIDLTNSSSILDNIAYDKASNTKFYRTTATENLTKATHTESTYTPSPSKYYKVDTTKTSYNSDTGMITYLSDTDTCVLWVHSILSEDLPNFATESTVDDYDFYLDTNGGYYPKNLHKTYLIQITDSFVKVILGGDYSQVTVDYTTNKIVFGSMSFTLNSYPVNTDKTADGIWIYPIYDDYGVDFIKLLAYSDDDSDTSIQKYIKYEDTYYMHLVVHPYLKTAYLIRKTNNSNNDTNTISYKDEFSKSMLKLATTEYVDNNITSSIDDKDNITELTLNDLLSKIQYSILIPNHHYRITDYSITLNSSYANYVKVADTPHYFDIIVQALSTSTISPYASAIKRASDTTGYYSNSRLDLWKLEVSLFISGSSTALANHNYTMMYDDGTQLIITKMIDEFGNECPYDFKNLVMARYEITADSTGTITTDMFANGKYFTTSESHTGWTVDTANPRWFYTFSYIDSSYKIEDFTIKYASLQYTTNFTTMTIFGNNKIDLHLDNNDIGLVKPNCFIFSNKSSSNITNIAGFFVFNNQVDQYQNTINFPIIAEDSGSFYIQGLFMGNKVYSGSVSYTQNLGLSGAIDKYIITNSTGDIKVFGLEDLLLDKTTTLTSGTF